MEEVWSAGRKFHLAPPYLNRFEFSTEITISVDEGPNSHRANSVSCGTGLWRVFTAKTGSFKFVIGEKAVEPALSTRHL